MALSFSMTLAGLDGENFNTLRSKLAIEGRFQILIGRRRRSTCSSSDSSGVGSLGVATISPLTSSTTSVASSRSSTPTDENIVLTANNVRLIKRLSPKSTLPASEFRAMMKFFDRLLNAPVRPMSAIDTERILSEKVHPQFSEKRVYTKPDQKIMHEGRDILNLEANLRTSGWQLKSSEVPTDRIDYFMSHRSIYFRLGEDGLTEDYPVRECKECEFSEPSPYLFSKWNPKSNFFD